MLSADQATVTLNTGGYTATFASKNQGSGIGVTVSGLTLNNNGSGNYTLTQPAGITGTITAVTVTVSGITANSRAYDGTQTATLNFTSAALSGVLSADQATVTLNTGGYTATFASKNQGSGIGVTVSGLTLNNNSAGNYSLTQPAGITGNITAVTVTVSGIAVNNKLYDGTQTATLNFTGAALSGVLPADQATVTLSTGGYTATFANAGPGTGISVTVSGLALNNNAAGNYSLTQPAGLVGNISSNVVTVASGITANGKTYDGSASATLTFGTMVFSGVQPGDTVTLNTSGYTAAFVAGKGVGNGKLVSVSGLTLGGADGGKYSLSQPTGLTANITARSLTVTATGGSKVYDGTATASVSLSDDRIPGDTLTDGYTSALFNNASVGTGKPISVSGISISGPDSGNYGLSSTSAATSGDITQNTTSSVSVPAQTVAYCLSSPCLVYNAMSQAFVIPAAAWSLPVGAPVPSYTETPSSGTAPGIYPVSVNSNDPNYATISGNGQFIILSRLTSTARSGQATLSWTAFPGATGYNIYQNGALLTSVTTTTKTITGLSNSTPYSFSVEVVGGAGAGLRTNTVTVTPSGGGF